MHSEQRHTRALGAQHALRKHSPLRRRCSMRAVTASALPSYLITVAQASRAMQRAHRMAAGQAWCSTAHVPSAAPAALVFAEYRLVAKKGEGTFSEVLKAQCVRSGRYVAIKCMKNKFESLDQVSGQHAPQMRRTCGSFAACMHKRRLCTHGHGHCWRHARASDYQAPCKGSCMLSYSWLQPSMQTLCGQPAANRMESLPAPPPTGEQPAGDPGTQAAESSQPYNQAAGGAVRPAHRPPGAGV